MSGKLRILVAEDDEVFLAILSSALQDHEVTTAIDGDEALKHVFSKPFDLVVTDILMPHKDGIEIIKEIRQRNPEMKIIAISSGTNDGPKDLLAWARTAGANDTLQKPFHPTQLLEKIKGVMGSK